MKKMNDPIERQVAIKAIEDLPNCYNGFSGTYDKSCIIGVLEELPSAQPDTTLLAQKIWTKVCLITDPEDANIQHEVIHYGDLKQVFLEVLGWEI